MLDARSAAAVRDIDPRVTSAILVGLLAVSLALRLLWLDYAGRQLMLDEGYYVSAAHKILGLDPIPADPYPYSRPGLDPVIEHPIGGKLIVAASIRLLGDNPFGWRFPSVLFGTAAILFTFLLVHWVARHRTAALVAAGLVALDPLMLIHSRVAMLEIFVLTFLLAGLYAYLAERPILAGALVAAGACCKLTGLSGLLVVAVFEAGRLVIDRERTGVRVRRRLAALAWMASSVVVLLPALLWLLNSRAGLLTNPFDHLYYMATYLGSSFSFRPPGAVPQSRPWEWLLNRGEIVYFSQGVLHMRGLYNPLLVFATIPVTLWAAWSALRRASEPALFVLAAIAGCYLPFALGALQTARHTYIYYFLPVIPAVAMGVGVILTSPRVPAGVRVGYLVAAVAAFVYFFPFRGLP